MYDTVIIQGVNGISNELKDTLRLGKVQTVIYMNSSTSMLAKDLQELSKYYKVEEIKAVDSHMYQSYVTSIAKLTKKIGRRNKNGIRLYTKRCLFKKISM